MGSGISCDKCSRPEDEDCVGNFCIHHCKIASCTFHANVRARKDAISRGAWKHSDKEQAQQFHCLQSKPLTRHEKSLCAETPCYLTRNSRCKMHKCSNHCQGYEVLSPQLFKTAEDMIELRCKVHATPFTYTRALKEAQKKRDLQDAGDALQRKRAEVKAAKAAVLASKAARAAAAAQGTVLASKFSQAAAPPSDSSDSDSDSSSSSSSDDDSSPQRKDDFDAFFQGVDLSSLKLAIDGGGDGDDAPQQGFSPEVVDFIWKKFDADGSGVLEFAEAEAFFDYLLVALKQPAATHDSLKLQLWAYFDRDQDRRLQRNELLLFLLEAPGAPGEWEALGDDAF